VKTWTEPAPDRAIKGVVTDLFPSRKDLIAENAFLRQQVIVLKRKTWEVYRSRSRIAACWWCWRISCVGWKDALHIVKPDTLVKWHRQGLRLFWRRKSQGQTRRTAHFGEWVEEAGKRKPVWRILPELLYGQFSKVRAGRKLKQVYTKMLCGERSKLQAILQGIGLSGQIQTAFVERLNLTLRHLVAALRRKTWALADNARTLRWRVALAAAYYNFCRTHHSLRVEMGAGRYRGRTPAMALGVTGHRWSVQEFIMHPVY
jgi:hypothetical protein